MNDILRGDIFYVDFSDSVGNEISGRRPALVISNDRGNNTSANIVTVLPITTNLKEFVLHLQIDFSFLSSVSAIMCEHIRTVSTDRLCCYCGWVDVRTMRKVDELILKSLGICDVGRFFSC